MFGVETSPDTPAVRVCGIVLLKRNDFPRESVGGHISVFLTMSKYNTFVCNVKHLSDLVSFLNAHRVKAGEEKFALI